MKAGQRMIAGKKIEPPENFREGPTDKHERETSNRWRLYFLNGQAKVLSYSSGRKADLLDKGLVYLMKVATQVCPSQ